MASPIPDGPKEITSAPSQRGLVPYVWLVIVLLAQTALATFLLRETEWGVASLISLGLSAVASGLVLLRVFEARLGRVQRKLQAILSEIEHARPNTGTHPSDANVFELIDCIAEHTSSLISMTRDREIAEPVLNRIVEAARLPLTISGESVDIKVRLGAAMYPEDANSETNLLLHAQITAERSSRLRTASVFSEAKRDAKLTTHLTDSRESFSLQSDLTRAIAERQLFLVYQPKLDLKTGLFTGVEALIRWRHPKKGLVSPDQFIPMAEENGLMQSITEWVLTEGAVFAKALCSRRPQMCVSVNIAAQDIEREGFSAFANQVIRDRGILPGQICLEVTESGLFEDTDNVIATLSELSSAGLKLSIDDFGTGYSTLKQLQLLPVNEMKIDRTFVGGLASSDKNQAIVRSMIDMGTRMGLRVVAEGVESFREMQFLQKLGCDEVQGFFISRPLPAQEVLSFIDLRHALYDSSREDARTLASQQ